MVMTRGRMSRNHQQFSALNTTDFDPKMFLHLDQNYGSSCFPPSLQRRDTAQQNPFDGLLKHSHPCKNTSLPEENGFLKGSHCSAPRGLDARDNSIDAANAPKRKFLIFDRSDNNTKLYFSHQISPGNEAIASNYCEKISAGVDQPLEEKWDENHVTEEVGDVHEDTEELNALLYSDSDEEYDDDYEEVTSMAHAPFDTDDISEKVRITEELASCEGSSKRQRLLDVKYKGLNSTAQERKVKVHEALNILKTIIPGSNSRDPISLIDDAIVYLKAMKNEAESLGFFEPSTC